MKLSSLIYVSDKFKDIEITEESIRNGSLEESLSKFARFVCIPTKGDGQLEIYSYMEFFLMGRSERDGILVAITSSLSETDEYIKELARKSYLGEEKMSMKDYLMKADEGEKL